MKQASDNRDITDFKEAVQVLAKALPELTYDQLEKECRKRSYKIFLIALVGGNLNLEYTLMLTAASRKRIMVTQ